MRLSTGCVTWRCQSRGCPDVLGQLRDGRMLGVEVKGPTGKLRPEQAVFLDRIRGAGGVAFVARDCRDVMRELHPPETPTPRQAIPHAEP